jgi:hypothetical protein
MPAASFIRFFEPRPAVMGRRSLANADGRLKVYVDALAPDLRTIALTPRVPERTPRGVLVTIPGETRS